MYGENDVSHLEVSGDLKTIPSLVDVIQQNVVGNADAIRWNNRYYSNNSIAPPVDSTFGFPVAGKMYSVLLSGKRTIVHMQSVSATRIEYYQLVIPQTDSAPYSNSYVEIEYYDIKLVKRVGSSVQFNADRIGIMDFFIKDKIALWSELLDVEKVIEIFNNVRQTVSAPEIGELSLRRTSTKSDLIPSEIRKAIDASVFAHDLVHNVVPEIPFGDLAMEASQKTLRNDVNMIAFIRDLKNPKALIPKLKNLSSLKTHSGNYLGVKYGVLPTADDLTNIVKSLKTVSPFLDKNGYTVQSAVAVSSASAEVLGKPSQFIREQRIKIAIDNEDVDFSDLIQRVESAGFMPTFENIWDLVPYSFVLDWFINVGDFLERVDTRLRLLRLNIRYATLSQKLEHSFELAIPAKYATTGKLTIKRYNRWTQDHSPVPPFRITSTITAQNHWLEGAALILTRNKK